MADDQHIDFLKPGFLLRWWNSMMTGARDCGLQSFRLDPDEILAAACKRANLKRDQADTFMRPLRTLCQAFGNGEELTYLGFQELHEGAIQAVQNRLTIEQAFSKHEEIAKIRFQHPIVIAGFPRTGTTLLQSLLIQDPQARWLRPWEPQGPYPAGDIEWGGVSDERRAKFENAISKLQKSNPEAAQIHALDSPAECCELLIASFLAPEILGFLGIESYRLWLDSLTEGDWREVYAFYVRHLQYLAWRQPVKGHWVLKSPDHIARFDALTAALPDSLIVQTHRNPMQFVAAECWFIYSHVYTGTRHPDPRALGPRLLRKLSDWGRRCLRERRKLDAERFLDVDFKRLAKEPIAVAEEIYDRVGLSLPDEVRNAMRAYLKKHQRPKRSSRYYDLEHFGLTPKDVRKAFGEYCETFQLDMEDER